jgi:hypothetical protein
VIWGGTLVGRQVSTVQRVELEYLRSRGTETTPTRFKNSEDNRVHKLVLLPYKVGAIGTKLWNWEGPGGSITWFSDGLLHTTIYSLRVLRIVVERVAILGVSFEHGPQLHRIKVLIVSHP